MGIMHSQPLSIPSLFTGSKSKGIGGTSATYYVVIFDSLNEIAIVIEVK